MKDTESHTGAYTTTNESTHQEAGHRHQLVIEFRTLLMVALAIIVAAMLFYVFLRLRVTYQTFAAATLAAQQVQEQAEDLKAFKAQVNAELNTLKATVYGPRTAAAKPSAVELWQRNRDAEIQKRLRALEQWRYRMDER